jgi:hypothetical protein
MGGPEACEPNQPHPSLESHEQTQFSEPPDALKAPETPFPGPNDAVVGSAVDFVAKGRS